jgi:hypothetical protein
MSNRKYDILIEAKDSEMAEPKVYLTSGELKADPVAAAMQVHLDMQNTLGTIYVDTTDRGRPVKKKKEVVRHRFGRDDYTILALHVPGMTYDQLMLMRNPDVSGELPKGRFQLGNPMTGAELRRSDDWVQSVLKEHGYDLPDDD